MIKILPIVAAFFVASAALAAENCQRADIEGAGVPLGIGELDRDLLDRSILAEANFRRCIEGLGALRPLSLLRHPAQHHSNWMAEIDRLTHKSSVEGRRTLRDRVASIGIPARTAAENLAYLTLFDLSPRFRVVDAGSCRFTSPKGEALGPHSYHSLARHVVSLWMESPGHRRNLLSRETTHVASAAAIRSERDFCGMLYVTQIFVG